MIPWDDPKRDHGDAQQDFAVIVADVESRGLPKPGSSGDQQITTRHPAGSTCRGQCMSASAVIHGIIRRDSRGTLNGKCLAHPRERNVLPGSA